jgi:hypothetical protein
VLRETLQNSIKKHNEENVQRNNKKGKGEIVGCQIGLK